ncbi:MAG: CinA family protein [Legionellaceae bacterium]|nr:CinA family protein [Legionellaceae bacterium]
MPKSYVTHLLAIELGKCLLKRHARCAVAESCTGGSLAAAITDGPGSSQWFDRGFITYSNEAKQQMLGVSSDTLTRFGAVSEETVRAMAEGALQASDAQYTVAISGVAGPDGGSDEKPVGTVWIAWTSHAKATNAQRYLFQGDRTAIREQSVDEALRGLIAMQSHC